MFVIYIVLGFIFIGVVVIFRIYYSNSMKMTSYIDGQVIRSEERTIRDERERREETHIVCGYSVGGKDYQVERTLRGHRAKAYPPGRTVVVWYNPTVPEMSKLKDV